jgi:hypothetical protein
MPLSAERKQLRRRQPRSRAVLFSESRDWHVRQLLAAFRRRNVEAVVLPLASCAFDTGAPHGIGFGRMRGWPEGVLVRSVAAGSFEAVTRRLGILHALKALEVPVWNDPIAIERCVDKSMTTFLLRKSGIPVPETWAVEGVAAARALVEKECAGGPLVAKPLFGSQGRGLVLVRRPEDLPLPDLMGDV